MDNLMLLIDTATEKGRVALAHNGVLVDTRTNDVPAMHASFVQPAVQSLLQARGVRGADISAVAVLNGPGSYTGLRVSLASAKGLCYAWGKPLITITTLEAMALAASENAPYTVEQRQAMRYAPLIDARRMEVYYGVYTFEANQELVAPGSAIVDANFLQEFLQANQVAFLGSGMQKWQQVCTHPNAIFLPNYDTRLAFATLAQQRFEKGVFANLAYAEPCYAKAFYTTMAVTTSGER